jgi:hypothetical protein
LEVCQQPLQALQWAVGGKKHVPYQRGSFL